MKQTPSPHNTIAQGCSALWKTGYSKETQITIVVALIMLCVTASFYGCSRLDDPPNIILISIDALRADHLGCYGYSRNTSPNIDSFAKRNILFKNCYVHEPWTLPSHISMLTSLYPITHGVDKKHTLNPAIVTLAEVLERESYMTLGFVSAGVWTSAKYGFDQGFKVYHSGKRGESGEANNTVIREYLEKHKEGKLFLFVHYFDVHSHFNQLPYDAPSPFNNLFSNGYSGNFQGGGKGVFASKYLKYVNKKQIKLKEDDLNYIISLYDNGIAYMDKCIGDLFEMLKSMDLFENSLIIVTSDHGEEFQEHGYMLHSNPFYYEEIMHVPLIVKLPKADSKEGKIINDLVESIDIMPTIIDLLGVERPKIQGESLAGLINGGGKGKEYIFGLGSTGSLFIRSDRWKMVNDNGLQEGRFKLFDLYNDPAEHKNLIGKGLAIEKRLKRRLKERIEMSMKLRKDLLSQDGKGDDKDVSLTQEEEEKLRALGYLE